MTQEEHVQRCLSFIGQIRGIYTNMQIVDSKRDFVMSNGGYSLALGGLDVAINALEETIEILTSEDEAED